jgi:hypothetical protein
MRDILEDIQDKLQEGVYYIEEHVRVCIVLRILQQLGWDIWNPTEVNTEFKTVPNEDTTRVDVALFAHQYSPSVFIEIKAVGKMDGDLGRIEQQLRDYNRNNTAEFSIITDGQKWRFYYSLASGEFGKKCFKHIDIAKDDVDDVTLLFQAFLAKSEILNGNAKKDATDYLALNQRQQGMEDALPKARRLSQESPYPRLPEALITIVEQSGMHVSRHDVESFLAKASQSQPRIDHLPEHPVPSQPPPFLPRQQSRARRGSRELPPNGTKSRFKHRGQTYYGRIENNQLVVDNYGSFPSLSRASSRITDTSRNGWRDWEIQLPSSDEWVLAQTWREKSAGGLPSGSS